MTSRKVWFAMMLAGVIGAGCDDSPDSEGPPGLGNMDASTSPDGATASNPPPASDAGVLEDSSTPIGINTMDAAAPRTGPVFAVVSSDFTSTAVSILDVRGALLSDNYVTSGSAPSGVVTALSGDVVLPRESGDEGTLVLLDRFHTDVVTRIRLSDGVVLGQVKTETTAAYSSNPKDYIWISADTAWITRAEPNMEPGAPTADLGTDLLRINPTTMTLTTDRIDLSPLNQTTKDSKGNDLIIYARPTGLARVGSSTVVVGLERDAFDFSVVGDGAVAVVDLDTKTVTPVALAGYKDCSDVQNVPNDADTVLVTCNGDYTAADERDTAGLLLLDVSNGSATIAHAWSTKGDSLPDALVGGSVSLGGTLAVASASDFSGSSPDVLALVDIATGLKTMIASDTPGAGNFGQAAYDPSTQLLLVPDASEDSNKKPTSGVRRFQRNADGSFTELSVTKASVSTNFPARAVWAL